MSYTVEIVNKDYSRQIVTIEAKDSNDLINKVEAAFPDCDGYIF